MILIIISIALLTLYCLLMLLYSYGWWAQKQTPQAQISHKRVSVIIPARNEAENISAVIHSILHNNFPAHLLEVIVVNDFSTDETEKLATEALNGRGRVMNLSAYLPKDTQLNSYKKKALELAIAEASGEWIVTTDADCIVPINWLQHLIPADTSEQTQFIAAPVSLTPVNGKRNWLYYFQSLDFMTMQGITAASAQLGLGNMCNGANLAFRKAAFIQVGGYKGIDHIASGDDMLLMYKIQQQFPGGIQYRKELQAIVQTPVQASWRDFLNQRIRWSSKADKYQEKRLTGILTIVYFFNLCLPVLLLASIFSYQFLSIALVLFLVKILGEFIFLIPVARFYRKTNELLLFPLLQPLHIIYIISAGFLGKFGTYSWKGRKVS